MTERKGQSDPNETPEDVASLYSWANLHGAKYRDFSASRAQTREKARQRVEQAMEEEHLGSATSPEPNAQRISRSAMRRQAKPSQSPSTPLSLARLRCPSPSPISTILPQSRPRLSQRLRSSRSASRPPHLAVHAPMREREFPPPRIPGPASDPGKALAARLAQRLSGWNRSSPANIPPRPKTRCRDRASAWPRVGLRCAEFLRACCRPRKLRRPRAAARPPVMAIFSLAGGVGKTSLVATLGRALSARGERVLLVDTAAYGLLPFFFGAGDQRPGMLRTFTPPAASGDAPIQMITLDPENFRPRDSRPRKLSRRKSQSMRAAWAASSSISPRLPAPPRAASCACPRRFSFRLFPT